MTRLQLARAVAVHSLVMVCGGFVAMLALSTALQLLPGFDQGVNPNARYYPVMDANLHHLAPSDDVRCPSCAIVGQTVGQTTDEMRRFVLREAGMVAEGGFAAIAAMPRMRLRCELTSHPFCRLSVVAGGP